MTEKDLDWFKNWFRPHFDEWVTEKIRPLTITDYALESFILTSCAIDWLSSLWAGGETSRSIYKEFILAYFPEGYDPEGIYTSLRCGLVHMFTIKNSKYALTKNDPKVHLTKEKNDQILLNAGSFFSDWEIAKNNYFEDVIKNHELLTLLIQRIDVFGFLVLDR